MPALAPRSAMRPLPRLMLLLAAVVAVRGQGMFFKVEALKGYGNMDPDKLLGPYYIADMQCSGVLKNLTQTCEYLDVVQIQAVDGQPYLQVEIDPLLESAVVRRRPGPDGCAGRVVVSVAVGCGDAARSSARRGARSPRSPRLPRQSSQARQLPPMSPAPPEQPIAAL